MEILKRIQYQLTTHNLCCGLLSLIFFQLSEISAQTNQALRDNSGKLMNMIIQNDSIGTKSALLTVNGRVLTDDYVPAAGVTVSGPGGNVTTDSDGKFIYIVKPGFANKQFELSLQYTGYVRLKIIFSTSMFPSGENFTVFADNIVLMPPFIIDETVCTVRNITMPEERPKSLLDKVIKNIRQP